MTRRTDSFSVRRIEWTYNLLKGLFWFATALPLPLMVILAQARGLDLFQVGVVHAVYSLTVVVLEIPTGGLADAIGRKRVTVMAYGVTLLSSVALLVAFRLPVFLAYALLSGIGRALASGALDAWFVDALQQSDPRIDLHPRLARAGAVALFSLGAGTILGGLVAKWFSFLPADGSAILSPMAMTIVLGIGFWGLLIVLTCTLVREPERAQAGREAWVRGVSEVPALLLGAARLMAGNRVLIRLLAVAGVSGLVLSGVELLWQPHFSALLSPGPDLGATLGVIMAGCFLVGMAGNLLSPWLTRRLGGRPGWTCALFHAVRGVFLMGLALQTHAAPGALLFWLVYGGQGIVQTTHAFLLNEQIPAKQRSAMLSMESFVSYLGGFVASLGLGMIAERGSTSLALAISGGVLLVSWGLYARVDSRRKETKHERVITAEQADQA